MAPRRARLDTVRSSPHNNDDLHGQPLLGTLLFIVWPIRHQKEQQKQNKRRISSFQLSTDNTSIIYICRRLKITIIFFIAITVLLAHSSHW